MSKPNPYWEGPPQPLTPGWVFVWLQEGNAPARQLNGDRAYYQCGWPYISQPNGPIKAFVQFVDPAGDMVKYQAPFGSDPRGQHPLCDRCANQLVCTTGALDRANGSVRPRFETRHVR